MLTTVAARYSTAPVAGQRRAIAVNLVVFFAFALTAVVMLTRTAIAANSINRDVASAIGPSVGGIDHDATRLAALDRTARLTSRIATAARPLPDQLGGVVTATTRIDASLNATLASVLTIGSSVNGIRTSTHAIRPAIEVLGRHTDAIHEGALGIGRSLSTVSSESTSMVGDLGRTNASLREILGLTGPLGADVRAIKATVRRIDAHAASIANSPVLLGKSSAVTTLLGDLLNGL